jgi:hypothetical protein
MNHAWIDTSAAMADVSYLRTDQLAVATGGGMRDDAACLARQAALQDSDDAWRRHRADRIPMHRSSSTPKDRK